MKALFESIHGGKIIVDCDENTGRVYIQTIDDDNETKVYTLSEQDTGDLATYMADFVNKNRKKKKRSNNLFLRIKSLVL